MTDRTKWRLHVDEGRQVWKYEPNSPNPQTIMEKYLLGEDYSKDVPNFPAPNSPLESARNGIDFYQKLQSNDGHWPNDYGGPMFLLPGLVITSYITGYNLKEEQKIEIIQYLKNTQREDGGWGLHIESPSTMFGSALSYVTLRLLGVNADEETAVRGRKWITDQGTAVGIPSWGKFWLSVLGVYEWKGLNPIPPEFWLLPYVLPIHPGRWWCHCRMVYLPMGYLYARKAVGKITPLVEELRGELYEGLIYQNISWDQMCNRVTPVDLYTPHTLMINSMHWVLKQYEKWHSSWLRNKSMEEAMAQIVAEDKNTKYICIGPVNKTLNMLSVYFHYGEDHIYFKNHCDRLNDYLWLANDGMKMQGYNGSQLWDTAFSVQAIVETGLSEEFEESLEMAWKYLDVTQVKEEVENPKRFYRHVSVGAWPFSTRDHGWPISDCTAEGLKACFSLLNSPLAQQLSPKIEDDRFYQAVNVILSLQNNDGGWATYELQRGPSFTEMLNPSETFHGIMVDYPYVECTSACVQSLVLFQRRFPVHRNAEISGAIERGISYIKRIQRKDGSWKGSWGVCFTYGVWFGIEGLISVGETLEKSPHLQKATNFLLSKQNEDGGWGESFESCVQMEWVDNENGSQVVNTSWAVMSLLAADHPNVDAIHAGVKFLMARQKSNGNWEQESVSGVFNANCAISYSGYKNIFTIWALGRFATKYPNLH